MPLEPKVLNKYKIAKMRPLLQREYVGRPTIWGNPFVIGRDGTREEVVKKYEEYLLANEYLMSRIWSLKGRDLVCFCAPLPCHADVLLKYANKEDNNNVDTKDTVRCHETEGSEHRLQALYRVHSHFQRTTPGAQRRPRAPVAAQPQEDDFFNL